MIKTSSNLKSKLNNVNKPLLGSETAYITNSVNDNNIDRISSEYSSCDLYINSKLSIPINRLGMNLNRSKVIQLINSKLDSIEHNLNSGKQTCVNNMTQLNNLRAKILHWCSADFKEVIEKVDSGEKDVYVFIDNDSISKHEWLFIQWLMETGIKFIIITNNIDELHSELNTITYDKYSNTDRIDYKSVAENKVLKNIKYNNLSDIEQAIYENNEPVKLICEGVGNYRDTCNFYGKLRITCETNDKFMLVIKGFNPPSFEQIGTIPRFNVKDSHYVINTIINFINLKDKDLEEKARKAVIKVCDKDKDIKQMNGSILYNRLARVVIAINNILCKDNRKYAVVFYGVPNTTDKIILEILAELENMTVLILNSDKSKEVNTFNISKLALENTLEYFEMPSVDSRNNITTQAAIAQEIMNETLFNGETPGLYRPGQFISCNTKLFQTTFDEIPIWIKEDSYMRIGFEGNGLSCTLPVIFSVVKGVNKEYSTFVTSLNREKTIMLDGVKELLNMIKPSDKRGIKVTDSIDTNNTRISTRVKLFSNGKINKDAILSSEHYSYRFLSLDKQNLILDKIEEFLNSGYINLDNASRQYGVKFREQSLIDLTLETLLNLSNEILEKIQSLQFFDENTHIVVSVSDSNILTLQAVILLIYLSMLGMDIVILVPTCYSSIETVVSPKLQYSNYTIGNPEYNINIRQQLSLLNKKPSRFWNIFTGRN